MLTKSNINKNKILIEIALGMFFCFYIIHKRYNNDVKYENLALGTQTSEYISKDSMGNNIHMIRLDKQELQSLQNGIHLLKYPNTIFILGNSQTHSVNQLKDSQCTYVQLIHNKFSPEYFVMAHSLPNANIEEMYLAFNFWKDSIKIKYLLLPVFLDDTREEGIRDVFFPNLISQHFQIADSSNPVNKKINADLKKYWYSNENAAAVTRETNHDNDALKETVQEGVEKKLNEFFEKHSTIWQDRPNVRGSLFTWLYYARNTVLGINASSARKIISSRYKANMNALKALIDTCNKNNIGVLLYIPPIRFDVKIPYDQSEYSNFKQDLQILVDTHPGKIILRNYEKIIPGRLWGFKEATNLTDDKEIDFMHFQYRGHEILADSLEIALKILMDKK